MSISVKTYKIMIQCFVLCVTAFVSAFSHACTNAQMIDYDYQIKSPVGGGYSTFGRLWLLDGKEGCIESLKYTACFIITPEGGFAKLGIKIIKSEGNESTYSQRIKYNTSELILFEMMGMNVYFKLFVSNLVADMKMSGKSCDSGFPTLPRSVTKEEVANMFNG